MTKIPSGEGESAVVGDWKAELEDLAAINYNLYLAGTVERGDTGLDWTHDQALSEIKDFITTLLTAEREAGRQEALLFHKNRAIEKLYDNADELYDNADEIYNGIIPPQVEDFLQALTPPTK